MRRFNPRRQERSAPRSGKVNKAKNNHRVKVGDVKLLWFVSGVLEPALLGELKMETCAASGDEGDPGSFRVSLSVREDEIGCVSRVCLRARERVESLSFSLASSAHLHSPNPPACFFLGFV